MNLALCHIKLGDYESAIDLLTTLLHYDFQNVKGLYLRGKSYYAIRDYNSALVDFRSARELKPTEKSLFDRYIDEIEISIAN